MARKERGESPLPGDWPGKAPPQLPGLRLRFQGGSDFALFAHKLANAEIEGPLYPEKSWKFWPETQTAGSQA